MTTQNANGTLITTFADTVATLEFGHPASNSFPSDLLNRLAKELDNLSSNPKISIIILKSSGDKAFCAGASFEELLAVSNQEEGTLFFSGFAHVLNAMRRCSKLIIGRIHGKAVGGGVGIVAACDYTFATIESNLKLSELEIGIGPFVIEPAVTRKIGKAAMGEMTMDTEWRTAVWANQNGLFSKVFANQKTLDIELIAFAKKLSHYNPEALKELKKTLWIGTENWDTLLYERAAISGKLVLSEFAKSALSPFKK